VIVSVYASTGRKLLPARMPSSRLAFAPSWISRPPSAYGRRTGSSASELDGAVRRRIAGAGAADGAAWRSC